MAPNPFRPLSADQIQDGDDPAIQQAEAGEPGLRLKIRAVLRAMRDGAGIAAMANILRGQRYFELIGLIDQADTEAALKAAFERSVDLYMEAAQQATKDVAGLLDRALTFDRVAPAIAQEVSAYRADFISEILESTTQSAARAVQRSLTMGLSMEEAAREVADSIGLAPAQAQAVINYRRLLASGDREALRRALRDPRFDRMILDAIESEEPLSQAQIDAAVKQYAQRYVAFRAETIARTESLRAVNMGRRAAMRQLVDDGELMTGEIRRYWLTARDELVCPVCRSIPMLNPRGVGLDEPYQSAAGGFMMPPDPHPRCRCTERFSVPIAQGQQAGAEEAA